MASPLVTGAQRGVTGPGHVPVSGRRETSSSSSSDLAEVKFLQSKVPFGASLVAQWLRIHVPGAHALQQEKPPQ